jgi:hypothetical protein
MVMLYGIIGLVLQTVNIGVLFPQMLPMLSASFQMLHFRAFLNISGPIPERLLEQMVDLHQTPSEDAIHVLEESAEYHDMISRYDRAVNDMTSLTAHRMETMVALLSFG